MKDPFAIGDRVIIKGRDSYPMKDRSGILISCDEVRGAVLLNNCKIEVFILSMLEDAPERMNTSVYTVHWITHYGAYRQYGYMDDITEALRRQQILEYTVGTPSWIVVK